MAVFPPTSVARVHVAPPASGGASWVGLSATLLRRADLVALLAGTAVLYLWSLGASGWANSFYSAAAQAGAESWNAFLFGSLDPGGAITVDKPPASLWLMALSIRIFGLSSWSILVPQALLGVATVGVLYASVRRTSGHAAGLLAGAVLALTPVAALMFRFNNPDALLVFLLTLAGYATLRAAEVAGRRWLVAAGVLVGFAFLTTMLQAFLVLPAFLLVYLLTAPTGLGRRFKDLAAAFVAMVITIGWWVALVELVPAAWRPYVGGSENNSVLELIFGDNFWFVGWGLGRIFGDAVGAGAGDAGGGMRGQPGLTRLFDGVSGQMVTWLLPAALIMTTAALVIIGRVPRTDRTRSALLLWAGCLVGAGLTFSLMSGAYHDYYYTVALTPALGAVVAISAATLWRSRHRLLSRVSLAAALALTTAWAVVVIHRAENPYQLLAWLVAVTGSLGTLGLLVSSRLPVPMARAVIGLSLVAGLSGPATYTVNTVGTPHTGSIVTAGPAIRAEASAEDDSSRLTGQPPAGGEVTSEMITLLKSDAASYRWAAATVGSQSAARYQLASEEAVMAIGGVSGDDPSPTVAEFQQLVAEGRIHYLITEGRQDGGPGGGRSGGTGSQITTWVSQHFAATTIDGSTVYDLTSQG